MALVTKEFGWADAMQGPYTASLVYRDPNNNDHIYFLFFEWISPVIEKTDFLQIIQFSFKKFYSQPRFVLGLKSFASYLLASFREHALEEVDINFVIGKVTNKYIRLAKFGQADIYMYKDSNIADLSPAVPGNFNLNALDYVKLPLDPYVLLFVTNFGLFTSLIDNGMVQLNNPVQLLKDLDSLKQDVLESKIILMIADLDPNINSQMKLLHEKNSGNNLVGQPNASDVSVHLLHEESSNINLDTVDKKVEDFEVKDTNKSKATNEVPPAVTSIHKVGLQELENDIRKFVKNTEETLEWIGSQIAGIGHKIGKGVKRGVNACIKFFKENFVKVHGKLSSKINNSNIKESNVTGSLLQLKHDQNKSNQNKINKALEPNEFRKKVFATNNFQEHLESRDMSIGASSSSTLNSMDAVKYFRLRKSLKGRIYMKLLKIWQNVQKLFLKFGFKGFHRKSLSIIGGHLTGQSNNLGKSKEVGFKKLLLIAAGLFILFVIIGQIKKAYALKKQDIVYLQQAKESSTKVKDFYKEISNTPSEQDAQHFNQCFAKVQKTKESLGSLKNKIHFATNRSIIDSLLVSVDDTNQKCISLYKKVFNVKSLINSDIKVLKDFKTVFGEQSNVHGVAVYKGILVVTDYGRGIIYQVNPENGKVSKLKDPKQLVKEPYSVGFGENKDGTPLIFACDHQSGILYYVSGYGFKQIPGTDAVALGSKCMQVGGFGTNAYFTTENGTYLYKATNLGGSYAFPKAYITIKNSGKILDFAIDGSIYTLVQYPNVDNIEQAGSNAYYYEIEKYFGGKPDRFTLTDSDKQRMQIPSLLYTNPSGYKPLYIYDKQAKYIYVLEKPTLKNHPGIGTFIKTIDLSNINGGDIQDFAVDLSVNNNKEQYIYIVADNKLYKVKNP